MNITEFLTARLDEDERLAKLAAEAGRAATPRHRWMVEPWTSDDPAATPVAIWISDEHEIGVASVNGSYAADHIARHDPARVLCEVEAKRRLLDELASPEHIDQWGPGATPGEGSYFDLCDLTRRVLAAPYADHPDYQDSWKP